MAQVIKAGGAKSTCTSCCCDFSYISSDVKSKYNKPEGFHDMDGYTSYTVKCPGCGSIQSVSPPRSMHITNTKERDDDDITYI